jgi:hypothetical protein
MSDGQGKPGWCKICAHPAGKFLNSKLADDPEGFNAAKAQKFARELTLPDVELLTFNRQTFYSHREHVTHPLVSHARLAQENPVIVPKTNRGVLEAIRDIGMKRAVDHPEEVTVEHALKAAGHLMAKENRADGVLVILAKAISGSSGEVIEVPYIDVTPEEEVLQLGNDAQV